MQAILAKPHDDLLLAMGRLFLAEAVVLKRCVPQSAEFPVAAPGLGELLAGEPRDGHVFDAIGGKIALGTLVNNTLSLAELLNKVVEDTDNG